MRITISILLAFAAFLSAFAQAAPAQAGAPAAPTPLSKRALGKQRIAAAQYNPKKRAELEERTFINVPDWDFDHEHDYPSKPQPSQAGCKALPFMPCSDCCPQGYVCRNLLDWDKRDLAKVDKRTFYEKRCYLNSQKDSFPSKGQYWRREESGEEEIEQVY